MKGHKMNKLPIAAAGIVAMLTTSVLFAYAEPSEGITPAKNDARDPLLPHTSDRGGAACI